MACCPNTRCKYLLILILITLLERGKSFLHDDKQESQGNFTKTKKNCYQVYYLVFPQVPNVTVDMLWDSFVHDDVLNRNFYPSAGRPPPPTISHAIISARIICSFPGQLESTPFLPCLVLLAAHRHMVISPRISINAVIIV